MASRASISTRVNRRAFVTGLSAAGVIATSGRARGNDAAKLPLSALNLYGPVDEQLYRQMRLIMFSPGGAQELVNRLWVEFKRTGSYEVGEQALMFAFSWWRLVPLGKIRIRVAQIGQEMAKAIEATFPDRPAGPFFAATFAGTEGLARGVLDSLHLLPANMKRIREGAGKYPDYLYGMTFVLLGKLYIKLPPFPISFGDLDKGIEFLEQGRSRLEGIVAIWNLVYAEAIYLKTKDVARALEIVTDLESKIDPPNLVTRMLLDSTVQDAAAFRQVLTDGSYNKYTWDPMLTQLKSSL